VCEGFSSEIFPSQMAHTLQIDPTNQLEEDLQCAVCLEPLKDPRTLSCFHSFCKVCLEGVVETCRGKALRDQPIRQFHCPNCRETFTLEPNKKVADMPRNHFICNMVEATAVLNRGRIGVPCSHNCNKSSVARCVTCEKFLCQQCLTGHNNYRGHDNHSVLTMEELSKPENRKKIRGKMYCNEHSGMELKVYCETCDKLICKDCMDFIHTKPNHSCFLVKDVSSKYKQKLASKNKSMDSALDEGNTHLRKLSTATKQLDRDAENAKSQILQRNDTLMRMLADMVEQKAATLLDKVDQIYGGERAKLDGQTKETKVYTEKIFRSIQFSRKLVDNGTEEEIISSQKIMLDNANNLLTKRPAYLKVPVPVAKFSCTPCTGKQPLNEEIATALANCMGEVNYRK
jgi:uncharacterized protein YlaI